MSNIITKTPYRISFLGGGTDYPQWYLEHGGAVLATSIDKYCHIMCRYLPPFFNHKYRVVYSQVEVVNHYDEIVHPAVKGVLSWLKIQEGLEIHHFGDLPARSGMASSSAFTVGLLKGIYALMQKSCTPKQLSQTAIHIEQNVIGENVGSQDQISTAYGGLNLIRFLPNGMFETTQIALSAERKQDLNDHLMLFFTGISRTASKIAQAQCDNIPLLKNQLSQLHGIVEHGLEILQNEKQPIEEFGLLINEAWKLKQEFSDQISNQKINELYQAALDAGASGGKILGAGGGGFLLIFAKPEYHTIIQERLGKLIHVPFQFENYGSHLWRTDET